MKNANNRLQAQKKIVNLYTALAECGIKDITILSDENYVGLNVTAWNCCDGSDVGFTIMLEAADDYETCAVIAEPKTAIAAIFAGLL